MEEIIFLVLTIIVELPVALLLLPSEQWKRVMLAVISINMVTHPIAWFLYSMSIDIIIIEGGVILAEIILLSLVFPQAKPRAVLSGLVMNLLSTFIGIIIS